MTTRILAALALAAQIPLAAATCESLASLAIPHTTITLAESVAAGEFTLPPGTPAGFPGARAPSFKDVPAFCRVSATARPTGDSEIKIEVWMPASGWNGKFRGTGNGGLGGNLSFPGSPLPCVEDSPPQAKTPVTKTAPPTPSIIPKRSSTSATAPRMR